jgi:hypothetical protein
MDLVFKCPNCDQELAADASGSGSQISCPTCNRPITIPEPTPQNIQTINPISTSAAAKVEKHFSVPIHEKAPQVLIQKPPPPLEVAAKESDRKMRIRTIKHGECIEVGKDKFDEVVTTFLEKVGEPNVIGIHPITYSHTDLASRQLMADYGVIIVYRG